MYIQIRLFPTVSGSASTSSLSTSGSHQGVVIEHSELFIQPGKTRHMTYYCEECPVVLPERHVWHLVVLVLVTEQHWFEDRGWGGEKSLRPSCRAKTQTDPARSSPNCGMGSGWLPHVPGYQRVYLHHTNMVRNYI